MYLHMHVQRYISHSSPYTFIYNLKESFADFSYKTPQKMDKISLTTIRLKSASNTVWRALDNLRWSQKYDMKVWTLDKMISNGWQVCPVIDLMSEMERSGVVICGLQASAVRMDKGKANYYVCTFDCKSQLTYYLLIVHYLPNLSNPATTCMPSGPPEFSSTITVPVSLQ